jgi:DNA-binding MurR/RpiR family transcriptional regulator
MADESASMIKIGRFVLGAPWEARSLSIGSLARACGASPATVYRFCRSLGYEGYKQFQLDLAAALAQGDGVILAEFTARQRPRTIIRQVFEYNRLTLAETERMLDYHVLTQIAKIIQRSQSVLFLGVGGSASASGHAANQLLSLGLTASAIADPLHQIFATENVGRRDVVFGISHTGRNRHVIEAVRTARRRGAQTVALTNYPQSPLAAASAFQLITAFREHRINAAVSSSIVAQLCVLDSLYFILGSWGGNKARKLASEAEERASRMLRNGTAKTKPTTR